MARLIELFPVFPLSCYYWHNTTRNAKDLIKDVHSKWMGTPRSVWVGNFKSPPEDRAENRCKNRFSPLPPVFIAFFSDLRHASHHLSRVSLPRAGIS